MGLLADGREVVVKRCPYPAEMEADGLAALGAASAPVSAVLGVTGHVLVLERVGGPPDWAALGRAIAGLHRRNGDRFGWHRDNFQGMTRQHNGWSDDWPSFYVERRLRVHLADPRVPAPLRRWLERACDGPLPALLVPRPPTSLTHGDLWAAGLMATTTPRTGSPSAPWLRSRAAGRGRTERPGRRPRAGSAWRPPTACTAQGGRRRTPCACPPGSAG